MSDKKYILTEDRLMSFAQQFHKMTEQGLSDGEFDEAVGGIVATIPTAEATVVPSHDLFWCDCCEELVKDRNHRCEQWSNLDHIPVKAQKALLTLGHQQPVSVEDIAVEIEKASASWPEQATCNLCDWVAGHLHAVFFPVTLGHREESTVCPTCHGTGDHYWLPHTDCPDCKGLRVTTPPQSNASVRELIRTASDAAYLLQSLGHMTTELNKALAALGEVSRG